MKQRHKQGYKLDAVTILKSLNIAIGQDFFTLNGAQVAGLLDVADRQRYRKPKNANGSRGRYFHDRLQRHARLDA